MLKKTISVASPSAVRPSFESALEKSFEKSGARRSSRDCRNASVFQGGYQEQFNCIFVLTSHIWNFSNSLNSIRKAVFCKGKVSRGPVAIQEISSKYLEYPYVIRIVSRIKFWWIFRNGSGIGSGNAPYIV